MNHKDIQFINDFATSNGFRIAKINEVNARYYEVTIPSFIRLKDGFEFKFEGNGQVFINKIKVWDHGQINLRKEFAVLEESHFNITQ